MLAHESRSPRSRGHVRDDDIAFARRESSIYLEFVNFRTSEFRKPWATNPAVLA